jgi:multicomponent Na+:H+ antiporter subunit F
VTHFFVAVVLAILTLTFAYVYRLAAGPTVFDRLLGVSGLGTKTTLVLLLVGLVYGRLDMFVDISVAYALLSFVGSLAAARYLERSGER